MAKLGVSIAQCAIDGRFKIGYFIDDLQAIPSALKGISEVPAELKDLDKEEAAECIAAVVAELDPLGLGSTERAKYFISAGINFIEGVIDIFNALKAE